MTDAAPLPDPSLIDRQLQMLGELAEFGLEQARALDRHLRKTDPEPSLDELQAAALAYARVSRAVRLAILLQSKVAEADKAAKAAKAADAAAARRGAAGDVPLDPFDARKARVERVVERLAKAEHPGDADQVDDLVCEAGERLDDEDVYGDLLDRPMSEIVARLCKDLDLDPDWSALADELWARAEIASGAPGWPLAARLRAPPAEPRPVPSAAADGGWDGAIGDTS